MPAKCLTATAACLVACAASAAERRISLADYRDRMAGAWVGQSVGVAYGWPTEFRFRGSLVSKKRMPKWTPEAINETFAQDDLYVEMTFLDTLDRRGVDVSPRLAGIDFANSAYRLWNANMKGRNNLRHGIAPPWSGHPKFHSSPYDIDYQIEADFSGIVSPGCPNRAVDLGNVFGSLMSFGDGLYAGQFVGALYAEAFFSQDRPAIVETALAHIPPESRYAEMVRDVLAWYRADADGWEKAWERAVAKYYPAETDIHGRTASAAIDVRINGAFVLIGYLYGGGDIHRTMYIATRCGCDSDCNPSTACGVLFTSIGLKSVPAAYRSGLSMTNTWEHTAYTYPKLLEATERVARANVVAAGGRIEKDGSGEEWMVLPVARPRRNAYECVEKAKTPPFDVRYTDAEMDQIEYEPVKGRGGNESVRRVRR